MLNVPRLLNVPELEAELRQPPGQLSSKFIVPLLLSVPELEKLFELKIKLKFNAPLLLNVPPLLRPALSAVIVPELGS
jgi:hypothetical protein